MDEPLPNSVLFPFSNLPLDPGLAFKDAEVGHVECKQANQQEKSHHFENDGVIVRVYPMLQVPQVVSLALLLGLAGLAINTTAHTFVGKGG